MVSEPKPPPPPPQPAGAHVKPNVKPVIKEKPPEPQPAWQALAAASDAELMWELQRRQVEAQQVAAAQAAKAHEERRNKEEGGKGPKGKKQQPNQPNSPGKQQSPPKARPGEATTWTGGAMAPGLAPLVDPTGDLRD